MPFATTGMDLEGIMLNEIRERWLLYDFTHMWNIKQNKQAKHTHRYREHISDYQKRSGVGEGQMDKGD